MRKLRLRQIMLLRSWSQELAGLKAKHLIPYFKSWFFPLRHVRSSPIQLQRCRHLHFPPTLVPCTCFSFPWNTYLAIISFLSSHPESSWPLLLPPSFNLYMKSSLSRRSFLILWTNFDAMAMSKRYFRPFAGCTVIKSFKLCRLGCELLSFLFVAKFPMPCTW